MKNILICHVVDDSLQEVGIVKKRTHNQEFEWKKRMFPIDTSATWTDKKGIKHLMINVNESDGTYHFVEPTKFVNIDKCIKCGEKISIDARNVWDLNKRKTITAIWGIDSSYIMLLLIMGIVLVILGGALFYMIGENQNTQKLLQKYLPAKLILHYGAMYN